ELAHTVDASGLVLERKDKVSTLWTWAGQRANDTLLAALKLQHDSQCDNVSITMPGWSGRRELIGARKNVDSAQAFVSQDAIEGLKFSAALPIDMARAALAARNTARARAREILD